MTSNIETLKLRIAIVGGGLAGATLMNALTNYPHLDVNIYESAPEFSERGAAVGLSENAQRAMSELGPNVREALGRAGAVQMNSTRFVIGADKDAGTVILDLPRKILGQVVARTALLRELLVPVPRERMFTNKKLVNIEAADDGTVTISFKDGSKDTVDAVIGADGIHGYVREYILGADHPARSASFAGWWDCRALVPVAKAREILGEEYFDEPRQYAWCGNGGFLMHDVLDSGDTVQCVASVMKDNWDLTDWSRELDEAKLEEAFGGWTNSPIAKGMIKLLLQNPDLKAYPHFHHKENAPTYAKGHVCIMGDAAHAMTPWQGSGAGQAIEDAMILETVLGIVREPRQLDAAFRAYDEVRRARTQRIVESSKVTGVIMCGKAPDVGLDVDALRKALAGRWAFIYALDMAQHKKDALAAMATQ